MGQKIVVNRTEALVSTFENQDIHRDVLLLQETQNLVTGITIIHPKSRTRGHAHPQREEHYYVLSGSGYIMLDNEKHLITKGDDIYVPPTSVHTIFNPNDEPLEFFWAAINGEPKMSEEL